MSKELKVLNDFEQRVLISKLIDFDVSFSRCGEFITVIKKNDKKHHVFSKESELKTTFSPKNVNEVYNIITQILSEKDTYPDAPFAIHFVL